MLTAIMQQYMANVGNVTPTTTVLESGLSILPIFDPVLFVVNASTVPIQVTIKTIFDLGTNVNPLFSGTYTNISVQQTISPGQQLIHEFFSKTMDGNILTHELDLLATSAPGGNVLTFLRGKYDNVARVPPQQLPVVF